MSKRKVKPKMVQSRAIAANCLECAGGTTKERLLCHLFDCPLWEWRVGGHVSGNKYQASIKAAFGHWNEDWKELKEIGISKDMYIMGSLAVEGVQRAVGEKTRAK